MYLDDLMACPENMQFFPGTYYMTTNKTIIWVQRLCDQKYLNLGVIVCAKRPKDIGKFVQGDFYFCSFSGQELYLPDRVIVPVNFIDFFIKDPPDGEELMGKHNNIKGLILSDAVALQQSV